MKSYSVVRSKDGSVGYPTKFKDIDNAMDYYNKCEGGALLIVRIHRKNSVLYNESVLYYKGLTESMVRNLMGW